MRAIEPRSASRSMTMTVRSHSVVSRLAIHSTISSCNSILATQSSSHTYDDRTRAMITGPCEVQLEVRSDVITTHAA